MHTYGAREKEENNAFYIRTHIYARLYGTRMFLQSLYDIAEKGKRGDIFRVMLRERQRGTTSKKKKSLKKSEMRII